MEEFHVTVDGRPRRAVVLAPRGKEPAPVVLLLHGSGGSGEWVVRETRWDEKAAAEGILLGHLPDATLALCKERLRGVKAPDKDKIERWIKELDDERFAVRERAHRGLLSAGEEAKPFLDAALAADPSGEVKRRCEQLLKGLTTGIPPRKLQPLRAIALLEKIDRPEVGPLLEELAKQSTDEDVKQEIKRVLGQRKNQPESKP